MGEILEGDSADTCTDIDIDDNNTRCAQSYEEWVIKELTTFNQSAGTNLDVGQVISETHDKVTVSHNRSYRQIVADFKLP